MWCVYFCKLTAGESEGHEGNRLQPAVRFADRGVDTRKASRVSDLTAEKNICVAQAAVQLAARTALRNAVITTRRQIKNDDEFTSECVVYHPHGFNVFGHEERPTSSLWNETKKGCTHCGVLFAKYTRQESCEHSKKKVKIGLAMIPSHPVRKEKLDSRSSRAMQKLPRMVPRIRFLTCPDIAI